MSERAHPAQPSPCIGVCRIDPAHGYCVGCHRNIEEICAWMTLDESARLAIMALCEQRKARACSPEGAGSVGDATRD